MGNSESTQQFDHEPLTMTAEFMVSLYMGIWELLGNKNHDRVQPGQLKLKQPKSIIQLYNKYWTIFDYTRWPGLLKPFTW